MAIQNTVLIAIIINLGYIHAEIIHGTTIPTLDVTRAGGDWYVIKGPGVNNDIACITLNISQQSANNVTITTNITMTPESMERYKRIQNLQLPVIAPMSCALKKDSNVLLCENDFRLSVSIVAFDIDYELYMAVYLTRKSDDITSNNQGLIFILGRQSTLSDEIIDEVKQTNFYLQSDHPEHQLTSSHSSRCQ